MKIKESINQWTEIWPVDLLQRFVSKKILDIRVKNTRFASPTSAVPDSQAQKKHQKVLF